jgi:predicted dehydrogenase
MKLAIMGLGKVAELHVTALRKRDPNLFAGGWTRSPEKAAAFCRKFGGKAYASVEDLLGDKSVTAVLVATSTDSHFDYAKRALMAGKHVLLEKPLCERPEQIRALADLARAQNLVCMPSHNYIYAQTMRQLKLHVEDNKLGEITSFWAIYNKRHDASIGAHDLTMRELMIHHVYCMIFFLGRPSHIYATGSRIHFTDPAADDQLMLVADFPSGAIANLWGSFASDDRSREPWSCYFKVLGMKGSGVIPWDVTKFDGEDIPFWDDGTYWDSFRNVQDYFFDASLGSGAAPLSTLDDAFDAAVILDACRLSLKEKRRVEIDYLGTSGQG